MKVKLRVLTPVHIGSGRDYQPFDYFVYQDKVYFQTETLVQRFLKEEAPNLIEAYVKHVEKYAQKLTSSSDNKAQSKLRRESSFAAFLQEQDPNLKRKFAKCLEGWGRQGVPLRDHGYPEQEIKAHQKINGQLYIPATSLKGAIRTALLFDFLTRRADRETLEKSIQGALQEAKKREVKKEKIDAGIEYMAFYAGVGKEQKISYKDEKFDVLKFLRLSDPIADQQQPPEFMVDKVKICILKKGKIEIQEQTSWAEVITRGSCFYFELDIDMEAMAVLRKRWDAKNDQIVSEKEGILWKDIAKKMRYAFDFDWKEFNPDAEEGMQEARKKILTHIWNAIRQFSAAQLGRDSQWLKTLEPHAQSNRKLFEGLKKSNEELIQQSKKACILHVGYATGFHGTTAFLAFQEIKDYIRLLEHYKIGLPPKSEPKSGYMNPEDFPKSRRILTSAQATPMGWIELILDEEEEIEPISEEKPQATEVKSQQPEETQQSPTIYTGKIKQGAVVPAVVEEPGKPNKVRLLIEYEHYQGELVPMSGYSAELEKGTYCEVSINQLDKKKQIVQVGYKKIKKM
ncbi:CRISPR type III-A-associated RAMP protein Csm5 [Thermonema lapsum]|uniref:CRISPR system Cms protein Csm5 n=1 Tax=Thermonema lapsum TaxID=28195 RepID=A0A846MR70_9BACT|nr:type III-A CRISPR-associated RAMP protein Csm5 [Thermonema lapsum]NIK73931.1 CRISPR type III-A-associated RAMP protein Csm5 [Thermonema lapsum]